MARSTVFRYKNLPHDALEVGRQLNVAAVLTGRVSLRGTQLSISTELVDVANGWQLWGGQYNRPMDDIFTVEEEIAQQISENLRMKVTGDQKKRLAKRHTNDSEAYQLQLKGRYHWNKRTPEGFKKAMEFFQQAIDQDPSYALAHCGLSDCYNVLGSYTLLPPEKAYSRAKAAAQAALKIDPELGEAHASLAYVKFNYDWDFPAAERAFKKSINLNSGYAPARQWYSMFLGTRGRFDESIAQGIKALELDPLSLSVNMIQGWMLFEARRFEEAADQLEKTIEIDATFLASHFFLGMTYWMLGRNREALDELAQARGISPKNPHVIAGHGFMQAVTGDTKAARAVLEVLDELSKTAYVPAQEVAVVYIGLGELDEAMAQLELAFEERGVWLLWLNVDPVFDSIRTHPRFADLLERVESAH